MLADLGEGSSGVDATWDRRLTWLRRWMAVCWLALIAVTWRLWTPQVVFPQIPFFGWLRTVPGWVDWVAVGGMVIGLVGMFLPRNTAPLQPPREPGASATGAVKRSALLRSLTLPALGAHSFRASVLLTVCSTVVLVLLNQHRLQVWAYQFVVVALVLGFTPAGRGASLLRVLTVGIYFWSAVSKLDYTFLHGLGPELLRGTLGAFGLEPRFMRPEAATAIAWAFPLDELAVAGLLAVRRTRTIGLVGAVAMHGLLLAGLGPLGLDHSWGVLLWNVYFIGQDVLLFRRPTAGWGETGVGARLREIASGLKSSRVGSVAVLLAVGLPVLEPFGWLDHWPGWAVYAPAGERVRFLVGDDTIHRLPDELRKHVVSNIAWHYEEYRTDLWSLDALSTPAYPQGRFRTGIAAAVAERYWLKSEPEHWGSSGALLIVEGRADRFTGKRTKVTYQQVAEIEEYVASFRLNALPRKLGGW